MDGEIEEALGPRLLQGSVERDAFFGQVNRQLARLGVLISTYGVSLERPSRRGSRSFAVFGVA